MKRPTAKQVTDNNLNALPLVAGLMPYPERACEPLLGSDDGKWIFESIFVALKNKTVAQEA